MQAGLNPQLRSALGSPIAADLVSFLAGTAGLATIAVLVRTPLPLANDYVVGARLVGLPVHSMTLVRLLGAALVIAGVILVQR